MPPEKEGVRINWYQRIHLEDARGNRFQSCGTGSSKFGEDDRRVHVRFKETTDPRFGPPKKLILEDWVTLLHPIPFSFKDVPLP